LFGLQLLAEREARVACHESLQSARAWRDATHRGIAVAPASPDAGNSMWGAGIYRRRLQALLQARVLTIRAWRVRLPQGPLTIP
jgi:hypothetical protein